MNKPHAVKKILDEEDICYLPRYTVTEAAFYLRLSASALRAWISSRKNSEPLIVTAQQKPPLLSFVNLVEAYVLGSILGKLGISVNRVGKCMKRVLNEFSSENAMAEKDFEMKGVSLFLAESGVGRGGSDGGKATLDAITPYLRRIERDTRGFPVRLYPLSRTDDPWQPKLVSIDPGISFGRPALSVVGVPTEVIAGRFNAGEPVGELARDYECCREEIEEAIRYEAWRKVV